MPTNYWAVAVSVVGMMLLGYLWYSMGVFGRPWMMLIGKQEADLKKGANKAIGGMVLLAIIQAWTISVLYHGSGLAYNFMNALTFGLTLALGLVLPIMLAGLMFEGRPMKLFWINYGYQLVNTVLVAMIVGMWK